MANLVKCNNCKGSGRVAHFAHLDNGVCYACQGTGKVKESKATKANRVEDAWLCIYKMEENGLYSASETDANRAWLVRKIAAKADIEMVIAKLEMSIKNRRG